MRTHKAGEIGPFICRVLHRYSFGPPLKCKMLETLDAEMNALKPKRKGQFLGGLVELYLSHTVGKAVADPANAGRKIGLRGPAQQAPACRAPRQEHGAMRPKRHWVRVAVGGGVLNLEDNGHLILRARSNDPRDEITECGADATSMSS